eukprot:Sspe_Gene.1203::Locus_405_Transcript_1_3_Confidence_0.714_Length_7052::g.1203::m.1203
MEPGGIYRLDDTENPPPTVNCTLPSGGTLCAPRESVKYDECGCPMGKPAICLGAPDPEGCCKAAPEHDPPQTYDCQGYPNLFISCWKPDQCNVTAAPRPECQAGTEGERWYSTKCYERRSCTA